MIINTESRIDSEMIEKIQQSLNDLKKSFKKLNDCHGLFQFPMENDQVINLILFTLNESHK